jgi:hypothetical protein
VNPAHPPCRIVSDEDDRILLLLLLFVCTQYAYIARIRRV